MFNDQHFDVYSALLESKPELYTGIEIYGVREEAGTQTSEIFCEVNDENPQFFSAYARDIENGMHCVASVGMSKLDDLRVLAKSLADQHNWKCQDFTLYLPVGTRIISIKGETADTDEAHDVFTGENAEGVITQILIEQEHCYMVDFPFDVSIFLSQLEISDGCKYKIQPDEKIIQATIDIDPVKVCK